MLTLTEQARALYTSCTMREAVQRDSISERGRGEVSYSLNNWPHLVSTSSCFTLVSKGPPCTELCAGAWKGGVNLRLRLGSPGDRSKSSSNNDRSDESLFHDHDDYVYRGEN
jgi:hypothetical protein